MQIKSTALLKAIFSLKGNLAEGFRTPSKMLAGVEVARFKNNAGAASCISADFEMGWGWRSRGFVGAEAMGGAERRQVPMILKLLDEFSVPITWATIGHLFLESCKCSSDGVAHPEMPRPLSDGTWEGDWYWPDPCSDMRNAPGWYGPDLIQQITESRVPHEIGTHSFSHINFQAPYSSPEVVSRELETCAALMEPLGLRPRTLIFPRNQSEYAYLPLFAEAGVTVVRHRDSQIRLSYPERMSAGVYRVYESMNLRIARGYDYLDKVKIFVGEAVERNAAYSLWFHPSDPVEWFDPQLRAILRYLDGERACGRLWITTMQELAAYCEARECLDLRIERSERRLTLVMNNALDVSRYGVPDVTLLVPMPTDPRATWLETSDGERVPLDVRLLQDGSRRAMANVPANAKRLHFDFDGPVA